MLTEKEAREALFGPALEERRKAAPAARPDGLLVIVTARQAWGGLPRRLELRIDTISRLEAHLRAFQQVRAMGLRPHALIDIQKI